MTIQRQADAACLKATPCALPTARAFATDLAHAAPMSSAPFSYLAVSKALLGDFPGAEAAAKEALKRTPRATLAHAILADAAGRRGDLEGRLFHLDRMLELRAPNERAMLDAIADLAMTPAGLAVVRKRIEQKAFWSGSVLNTLVARQVDPLLLLEIGRDFPGAQDRLLSDLLVRRGPQAAFSGWLETAPPEAIKSLRWPVDPTFTRVNLRLPFNWAIRSEGAEFEQAGGLYVSYNGRGRRPYVEQIMMLGPGQYTLAAEMSGELELKSGSFGWSITCLQSNTELGMLRVERLATAPAAFSTPFTVPSQACPAQRLTLFGLPGEFPRRGRTSVKSVTITPIKGSPARNAPSPAPGAQAAVPLPQTPPPAKDTPTAPIPAATATAPIPAATTAIPPPLPRPPAPPAKQTAPAGGTPPPPTLPKTPSSADTERPPT